MKKPLIIITGPTASGKTALSIKMAKKHNGEIVNADSMQVYKHMNIGTAKPTYEEREGIAHHLIDIIEPTINFSLGDYVTLAKMSIDDICARGKIPILVGGTGLYIDTLVYNVDIGEGVEDIEYRNKLIKLSETQGKEALHRALSSIDPKSADRIHPQNLQRVIRALEVYHVTGETMTQLQENSRKNEPLYDYQYFAINVERELLYNRINARVDKMFDDGLVEEVKEIVNMGVTRDNTAMQGIGYKEILNYFNGNTTLDETKNIIKQGSRRYAKRQLTWFRKNSDINWLDFDKIN